MKLEASRAFTFLLCESIRQEQGGRLTVLGLFPGNRVRVPPETTVVTLPLTMILIVQILAGRIPISPVSVSLSSPNRTALLNREPQGSGAIAPEAIVHTTLLQFLPFQTDEFGAFTGTFHFGDEDFPFEFVIEKATSTISSLK